jgi:orotate phosphoribosyltransferase
MEQEEVLDIFRGTGALLEGHFELRSGLHSPAFFQCAKVLCYPRHAATLCGELVSRMRAELGSDFEVDTVIAPAMGGIAVGHEVAKALDVRSIFAEKEDDKLVLRRFDIKEGERLVIAEDVVTRGGRVQEVIDIVESRGGIVAAIALLVDRSGGKASFDYNQFSLLKIEPVTHEPSDCPLCEKGLELVHPGS